MTTGEGRINWVQTLFMSFSSLIAFVKLGDLGHKCKLSWKLPAKTPPWNGNRKTCFSAQIYKNTTWYVNYFITLEWVSENSCRYQVSFCRAFYAQLSRNSFSTLHSWAGSYAHGGCSINVWLYQLPMKPSFPTVVIYTQNSETVPPGHAVPRRGTPASLHVVRKSYLMNLRENGVCLVLPFLRFSLSDLLHLWEAHLFLICTG